MSGEFERPPVPPSSSTPIGDALDRLGSGGEGLDVTVETGKDQKPSVSAGGWFDFGTRDQFGVGGAVQWMRDQWTAVGKFTWRPRK
jgi:hypothetical protein